MVDTKAKIIIIAYGFTSLLLFIGFLIYSGGAFANMFTDASEAISFGKSLMIVSVLLYILDTIILFLMWYYD